MSTKNSTFGKIVTFTLDHDGREIEKFDLNVPAWITARNLAWQLRTSICNTVAALGIRYGHINVGAGAGPIVRFQFVDGDLDFEHLHDENRPWAKE